MNYLLFDWGGVISENFFYPYTQNTHEILSEWGDMPDISSYRRFIKSFERSYLRGEVSGNNFWEKVLQEFSIEASDEKLEALIRTFVESMKVRPRMIRFLEKEKDNSIVGLISNTYAEMKPVMLQYSDLLDFTVLSCDHNTVKPERKIYDLAYQNFKRIEPGLRPEDIMFFDDKTKNVEAGIDFGFRSQEFNIHDFETRLLMNA